MSTAPLRLTAITGLTGRADVERSLLERAAFAMEKRGEGRGQRLCSQRAPARLTSDQGGKKRAAASGGRPGLRSSSHRLVGRLRGWEKGHKTVAEQDPERRV